jgi:hypothetical protein
MVRYGHDAIDLCQPYSSDYGPSSSSKEQHNPLVLTDGTYLMVRPGVESLSQLSSHVPLPSNPLNIGNDGGQHVHGTKRRRDDITVHHADDQPGDSATATDTIRAHSGELLHGGHHNDNSNGDNHHKRRVVAVDVDNNDIQPGG